ncbi:MAG TPA: ribosome recycling factor [Atribacteraceae bacterium]|nr:ribosome recycling factor [Atribacteraceae bacterium]
MADYLKDLYRDIEKRMKGAIHVAQDELSHVKTGRAAPALVENVEVDYYGALTPLVQIASITTPDAKTILIQPWDKNALQPIEKAIWKSDLGFNPIVDSAVIRINVPPLTEERRKEIAKLAKKIVEETKVAVRNLRREANDEIKRIEKSGSISEDDGKKGTAEIQKMTDQYINETEGLWEKKEKEIMTI